MVTTNNNDLLHTFSIDFHSEAAGTRYRGTFTAKKLTVQDQTQLGVRRVQRCGGLHYNPDTPGYGIDIDTFSLNSMVAHLELALVDVPDWWDIDKLTDFLVLSEVYKEVASFENTFQGSGGGTKGAEHRGSSQSSSEAEEDRAVPAGSASKVVEGQVSASLEP